MTMGTAPYGEKETVPGLFFSCSIQVKCGILSKTFSVLHFCMECAPERAKLWYTIIYVEERGETAHDNPFMVVACPGALAVGSGNPHRVARKKFRGHPYDGFMDHGRYVLCRGGAGAASAGHFWTCISEQADNAVAWQPGGFVYNIIGVGDGNLAQA